MAAGNNTFTSGLFFNSYMRGVRSDGDVFPRSDTQSLVTSRFLSASSVDSIPRNTSRRRSFEKIMPFNGYYDRTGFNMPVSFGASS